MTSFDEFWSTYPRRCAKKNARTAWDRALGEGALAEEIIEGARRYANERTGEEQRYTKHPATWLNGGCWDDEPGANSNGSGKSIVAATERICRQFGGTEAANSYMPGSEQPRGMDYADGASNIRQLPQRRFR